LAASHYQNFGVQTNFMVECFLKQFMNIWMVSRFLVTLLRNSIFHCIYKNLLFVPKPAQSSQPISIILILMLSSHLYLGHKEYTDKM